MELSDYVTIVITVPETHANAVREAMGKAGAGLETTLIAAIQ